MDVKSPTSSYACYEDGVLDNKIEAQYDTTTNDEQGLSRDEQPSPRLPKAALGCLILLFIFSFITIITSGIVFSHGVASTNCLAQSWVMFSAIMGFLYICLHLQAARKGDPVNRARPSFQNPLHSSAIVVARIDMIAWIISLMAVSVAVSKTSSPISCVNLVACAFVTPALTFLLCLDEKASRPFDLPYLTPRNSRPSSLITCRVSTLMANIMSTEVTSDDSISRRASAASSSPSTTLSTRHKNNRPNSHTQHAAAIAASTVGTKSTTAAPGGGGGGGLGGPRPPPASVKEARPWSFTKFDDRTKKQLAASVSEASHSSETRARVGGPRPLAASDIAVKTGVLPPPVCTEPKRIEMPPPQRERVEKDREREAVSQELVVRSGSGSGTPSSASGGGGGGGWKGEWSALRSITGWYSPANSSATTPVSTPGLEYGLPPGSQQQPRSRPLSTVAEDPAPHGRREITYHQPTGAAAASPSFSAPVELEGSSAAAAAAATVPAQVARRARTVSHAPEPPPYTSAPTNRPRCLTGPRGPEPQQQVGGYLFDNGASIPRLPPPPPAATAAAAAAPSPTRAPTTARVRLQRAQDALKTHGRTMSGTMVLNRPQRLTGDRRGSVDDRMALRAPVRGGGGEGRMPGSFVE